MMRQSDKTNELLSVLLDSRSRLLSTARHVLRDEMEAEDIVQEVMETVISAPNLLEEVQNVAGWLATLVYRRSVDTLRKLSRRRFLAEGELEKQSDDNLSASELLEEKEIREAIFEAIENLPPELLYVFEGNVLDEKPFRQLAEESGIPMGTLMARKQSAVKRIREELTRRRIIVSR
ncbi:MAG TPA: sigma-70 family RNA polymerase sigma factor [bacterium]|nr:sigma-70 family RNA polymerase sigma factor [bacterium]